MYREGSFESNVKWFVFGAGGIAALCQVIMLVSEFKLYSGAGILFNGLYHFIAFSCPITIIFLVYKGVNDKEVYSGYTLALQSVFAAFVDICLLVKYIIGTKNTDGFKVWIIILGAVLIILEFLNTFIFIRYALDKVTGMVPILLALITCILKGTTYSIVDGKFSSYVKDFSGSFFSIWMFMHLLFYLAFIICLMLYLDAGFFEDLLSNPKELFSSKTLFGTYTNLYLDEGAEKKKVSAEQIILSHNSQINLQQNMVNNTQTIPSQEQNIILSNNTVSAEQQNSSVKRICPDCGGVVDGHMTACPKCGCPVEFTEYVLNQNETSEVNRKCPECGNVINVTEKKCNKCGYPIAEELQQGNYNHEKKLKKPKWLFIIFAVLMIVSFFVTRRYVFKYSAGKILYQIEKLKAEEEKEKWDDLYESGGVDFDQYNDNVSKLDDAIEICKEQMDINEKRTNTFIFLEYASVILLVLSILAFSLSFYK